jgi:arylsulfatase A-like enzyme
MSPPPSDHLATDPRPVDEAASTAARQRSILGAALAVPPLGALFGGASVGLCESLLVLAFSPATHDYSGVIYGLTLYSLIGLLGGLGLGIVAAVLAKLMGHPPLAARSWSLSFLAVFCSMGVVIGRFIVQRNVYAEGAVPLAANLWLVGGFAAFAVLFHLVVSNALAKTFFSLLLRWRGALITYALFFVFWLMIAVALALSNREAAEIAPRPVAADLADRPNVLLIVVDTLRADALGTYGAPGDPSPRLDAFAANAQVFEQAIAQSSWTRPSFATLLTATPSCTHQCARKGDKLPDEVTTLAESLQAHGYTTGAIVNNINITASYNFQQGFDTFEFLRPHYPFRASEASFRLTAYQVLRRIHARLSSTMHVEHHYHPAPTVTDETIDWLRVHGQERWFLMVQYMDPHDPYFPHPADGSGYARVEHPHPDAAEAARLKELYAGEVSYWDRSFGRLVDFLDEHGYLDSTVVVVTSDHGEEFAEHGGFWHGTRLYDESVHVPLVVRMPDADEGDGKRVRDQVRSQDIAPTLAALTGSDPGPEWAGYSLLENWELREPGDRLALGEVEFEGWTARSVRQRDWKLIANPGTPAGATPRPPEELYFLKSDPGERADLSRDPSAAFALQQRRTDLEGTLTAACGQAVGRVERTERLSPDECEALKALGYLDAEVPCRP